MSDIENPGNQEPNQPDGTGGNEPKNDQVAWETYDKAMGSLRKTKDKLSSVESELDKYREADKKRQEQEMADKGEFQKIIGTKDEEITTLRGQIAEREQREQEAKKFSAFLKTVGGEVDEKFWGLIDISDVAINPDTGEVDKLTVTQAVDNFKNQFGEIIRGQNIPNLPNNAPASGTVLTVEEWKKLPLKEKKARLHEVYKAPGGR